MKNILLVEDTNEIYQMVLQSAAGLAQLHWAQSIKEAMALLNRQAFNLLILDVELPDGNGINFCSSLQRNHPKLPIFFLTSHTNLAEKSQAFTSGADSYLTKPFTTTELRERILAVEGSKDNMALMEKFLGSK